MREIGTEFRCHKIRGPGPRPPSDELVARSVVAANLDGGTGAGVGELLADAVHR